MTNLVMDTLRLSHTTMTQFRHCEEAFHNEYVLGLESKTDKWRYNKDLGSAVHAGIEQALHEVAMNTEPSDAQLIEVASQGAIAWVSANTVENKRTWDDQYDVDYYASMKLIREQAPKLLDLHIPLLKLGDRYRPVMASELWDVHEEYECDTCGGIGEISDTDEDGNPEWWACDDCDGSGKQYVPNDYPMIEYVFEVEDTTPERTAVITGMVDAVLYDNVTKSYQLFDWKCRGALQSEDNIAQDAQMVLYATVLNQLITTDVVIAQAVQYQMFSTLPAEAKLKGNGQPSVQTKRTTWSTWWGSLPAPLRETLNEQEWYELMDSKGKLTNPEEWIRPVTIAITPESMIEVSNNTELTIDRMAHAVKTDRYMKSWHHKGCEICPFKKKCQAERHGLDVESLVSMHYNKV